MLPRARGSSSNGRNKIMKKALALGMGAVLAIGMMVSGCAKKGANPLEPNTSLLADQPRPTPTAVAPTQGKSTVVVKTMYGNTPLSNVSCKVQFASQPEALGSTDAQGKSVFVVDPEGNYTATVPAQGDLLLSQLNGYVKHGETNTIIFQAGGSLSVTPTAINYTFSGGSFPIIVTYRKDANSLNTKLNLSVVNLPGTWSATFSGQAVVDGQSTTMTVSVPSGATDNIMNLSVKGSAQTGSISLNSPPFAIYRNWVAYADINVTVMNGVVGLSGINFTVTDSTGQTYTATTQGSGSQTVRIFNTGAFSVDVPAQGNVIHNTSSGTVSQAELKQVSFQVGSADINVTVQHEGVAWGNLPVRAIDNYGNYQDKNTLSSGQVSFHLNAIGNYTIRILDNPSSGILASDKTGVIKQGDSFNVNFMGRVGQINISTNAVNYVYVGNNYDITVTYANSGDIKYNVSLTHSPALPGLGTAQVSQGFGQTNLTNNQSTYSRYGVWTAATQTYSNCKITASKPGTFGFVNDSALFNINSDWNLVVTMTCGNPAGMHKRNGWEDWWDSDFNISYTITGHNIPNGTTILVTNLIIMPQSWPFSPWVGSGSGSQPGWKYWHSIPDPSGQNLRPSENNYSWGGNVTIPYSNSYGINGFRNPYYGSALSSDGIITVTGKLGEKSMQSGLNFNY